MQVKELKKEGLNYELEITVEQKEIGRQVDDRLKEYGKTVKMPGFRPGKVPLDILKKRYGRAVMGEILEKAVNDSTAKAIEDKGLRPALQPKIEVKEFDEGKDLTYTVALEVLPEFEITDFKQLKLEKLVTKPEKKAVDETLERIAKQNQETAPIESDRATKKGDVIVMDFHGRTKDDGKEHPGMHAHDYRLELGSGQFIAGFEDQLIGKKAGSKLEVNVTFPENYQAEHLAGREAIFDVDIKEIHEPKDFANYDELAKKLGLDDEKALREAIEQQMQSEYDQYSRMRLKRSLLDMLDEKHDMDVPQGMLDLEFRNIRQQIAMERQDQVKDGELQLSDEEKEELEAITERRVRLGIILSEVGNKNNIQVSDHELQRAVIQEAQKYPGQEAQVFEYYRSNRQALEALRAPVFEDKVVDFILELADIKEKEVSVDELTTEEEEDQPYKGKKKSSGAKSTPKAAEKKDDKPKAKKTAAKSSESAGKETKAATAKKPAAKKKAAAKK